MIMYAKLLNWREYGDLIILECLLNGQHFGISTYKNRIYNAHLLKEEVYIPLDSNGDILSIDLYGD